MAFETRLTDAYIAQYENIWPNKTILDYFDRAVDRYPNKEAIIDKRSRFTYAELAQSVNRVALGLLEAGLKKGDVISIQLPNWNEFVILHLAATKIGAITNPLIPIYRDREIGYMVKMAETKMIVVPDEFRSFDYPAMIDRLKDDWPQLEHTYVVGENVPSHMKAFTDLTNIAWEERLDVKELEAMIHDPNELTEIIFTSGTTGSPKGVMHTHNTLCVSTDYWIERLKLTDDDVMFMPSTFGHQTGFGYGLRLPIHYGGTAVFQDVWNPEVFLEQISTERITFTASATPFLQDVVEFEGLENYDLQTFRAFIALGAPIPRAIVKEANEKVSFSILSGWGQSENGLVTLTLLDDSIEKLTGTDGTTFPHMEVKTIDEYENPCPPDVEGALLAKGPAQFVGYLKQPEVTESEHIDNWFITGDRATIDADGYIRITGRNKDIIIRGGENIPVAYVENMLYEHPSIQIAQIVAMPDARLQERACAMIGMKPNETPLTLEDIKHFLEEKGVAKQYWPERVEVLEQFPRTPSRKIQKFRLRDMIKQ
ncbi:AMP-binding protein [Geomicrobium sp. JCM 19039]|uniref:AMP-binding protein n=1 Tax=Geomicrobium sp. JCM 19039 TaxID=1460636 RepID=UPI00045F1BFC|nr:AMP-binding protein [Geomicrobium sp. JCM 19039]GAK14118.1 long-chain-fatty-acid-CoA ligase [Geomicrobium sp. JCM 19039]